MIRTILVPTDFSDASTAALLRAEEVARLTGAKLLLVHVRDEFPFVADEGTGFVPAELARQHAASQEQVRLLAAEVEARGLSARGIMVLGDAPHRILDLAAQEQVDLIVLGTHGRKGLERLVIGSVAQLVVRGSLVPVMIVSSGKERGGAAPYRGSILSAPGPRPDATILVATDFDDASLAAVPIAFELAQAMHGTAHIMHVFDAPVLLPSTEGREEPGLLQSVRDRTLRRLEELASAQSTGVSGGCIATTGDPSEKILETSSELGADLIVLGTHGRSGIKRMFLGSVAERVMREAACPVVIVKPGDQVRGHFLLLGTLEDGSSVAGELASPANI